MSTLERAIEVAAQAHAGAHDKQGEPYVLHPLRVMFGVEGHEARIVAVLHDVVEDTFVTLEDIREMGFPKAVLEALALVTHEPGTSYVDYVVRCHANPIARQVKLSDLRDNTSLSRVLMRPVSLDQDLQRLQKYLLAYKFLTDQIDEAAYRQASRTSDFAI